MSEPIMVDGLVLDPELQFVLALRDQQGLPPITALPPEEIRLVTRQEAAIAAGDPEPVGSVEDLVVSGAAGSLVGRLYVPFGVAEPGPLLLFFHGGGFVFGDVETHDGACRLLCAAGGIRVLSVEYRLAPEHPYPAAIEDAQAALGWVFANASVLGASGIAVGGDSAGASLSAVVSQLAARDGVPALALQVLLYPAIDPDQGYPSVELFRDGFFLTKADMDFFEEMYAGGKDRDPADPLRYPLVGNLSGLAPALVVTAGFDPLRDEGEAYAAAMEAAGTPVTLRRYDSLIHGFINMIGLSSASRAALLEIAEQVGSMLADTPAEEPVGATDQA